MHKFLVKDSTGTQRDFGSSVRGAKFAMKEIGKDAVVATQGNDILWMLPSDVDYFKAIMGDFKVVNTAKAIIEHDENQKASSYATAGKERVSHKKFGEGSVLHGRGTGRVVVKFDSQKKAMPIAENFLTAV